MTRLTSVLFLGLLVAGCTGNQAGLGVLGGGTQDLSTVRIEVLADASDGLMTPTDLASNVRNPSQLWVTNYSDNSVTILSGDDFDTVETPSSFGRTHFLVNPMGIAFSDFGNFATIHDIDEPTQGDETPADFMGPTLWDDSDNYDGGHGGHLDMLHNTPLGGGIAWDADNAYWTFDGYHSSLTRYDFVNDHSYGGSDHTDGEIVRCVEGEVARIEGIPSHIELDRASRLLYVSDTANGRIAVVNVDSGTRGGRIGPNYDGATMFEMDGVDIQTLVDGSAIEAAIPDRGRPVDITELEQPAGLALNGDLIFVSDSATSRILAFDLEGLLVDWIELDVPAGSLGGTEIDADGRLLVTDLIAQQVLRLSAMEE